MPICTGNTSDHCCYLNGTPCVYIEENTVEGRRWACGLFRELGNWDAVHADERYVTTIQPLIDMTPFAGFRCGDWPDPSRVCATCGVKG